MESPETYNNLILKEKRLKARLQVASVRVEEAEREQEPPDGVLWVRARPRGAVRSLNPSPRLLRPAGASSIPGAIQGNFW